MYIPLHMSVDYPLLVTIDHRSASGQGVILVAKRVLSSDQILSAMDALVEEDEDVLIGDREQQVTGRATPDKLKLDTEQETPFQCRC